MGKGPFYLFSQKKRQKMWGNGGGVAKGIAVTECGGWRKAQDGKPSSIASKLIQKPSFVACGHFQAAAWKC